MPGYKVHDTIGLVTTVPLSLTVGGAAALVTADTREVVAVTAFFAASHLIGTYWLSPDLDMDTRVFRRWGILRVMWIPYAKLALHRSKLSHSAIGGPVRLLYLLGLLMFFILVAAGFIEITGDFFPHLQLNGATPSAVLSLFWDCLYIAKAQKLIVASVFLGSATSSWLHVLTDFWWAGYFSGRGGRSRRRSD